MQYSCTANTVGLWDICSNCPVSAETRIPTTPTARKVLQELKQPQGQPPFIPGCKTPGGFPMPTPSTLHNNVNATPRAANMAGTGIPGSAGPRRWRVPTPGPQYPITPEEYVLPSDCVQLNHFIVIVSMSFDCTASLERLHYAGSSRIQKMMKRLRPVSRNWQSFKPNGQQWTNSSRLCSCRSSRIQSLSLAPLLHLAT